METVVLGRTGLEVSVAGLGCGGHSRLGQATGATEEQSVQLVRRALDLGITYIDTARAYGTEEIVGRALAGRRDTVVLSTKAHPETRDGPLSAGALRESVQLSLRRLGTEYIDVFHLHGVSEPGYTHSVEVLFPELERLRDEGVVRYIALSERFGNDPAHAMLERALVDNCWDVVMVGLNLLNPSARTQVLPLTREKNIGVEVMFAVRRALSQPDELRRVVHLLVEEGRVGAEDVDVEDPLAFLVHENGARSVVEAAYRFARHEPGCHVVLTGTGNPSHLEENVASINGAPLPSEDVERLRRLFGHLDHLSGN
jgi:aryl-alcohol dehydrogenase-like predicted oxidoreductase